MVAHRAGEPDGLTQRCERCQMVLVDYAPTDGGDSVVDITEVRPVFFPVHRAVIEVPDGLKALAVGEPTTWCVDTHD